ncbi:MAG TPA: sugar nucleotide-binding protein [Candidatus Cloacimonadota bacterium]|nr:sugar nucleotide-binding protein [Candidatus Cloacimonadota bacterium]
MKIAVTGANGFLGSKLVSRLTGYKRQTVALLRPNADRSLLSGDQEIRELDYSNPASIRAAISDCDVVIHNAGKTRTLRFEEMLDANLGITAKLIEAVNGSSVEHFIYISSQAASRPSMDGEAINESSEPAPVNWYGKSKLWAERAVQSRCQKAWTIVRPVPVYGEGDRDFLSLFRMAASGFSFSLGSQRQILNMIHADQLCDFIQTCIATPAARNELFFASDGQHYTQGEIISMIMDAVGKRPLLKVEIPIALAQPVFQMGELLSIMRGKASLVGRQKYLELSAPHWNCDVSKARRLLGWNPELSIERRMQETWLWYRAQGWL